MVYIDKTKAERNKRYISSGKYKYISVGLTAQKNSMLEKYCKDNHISKSRFFVNLLDEFFTNLEK